MRSLRRCLEASCRFFLLCLLLLLFSPLVRSGLAEDNPAASTAGVPSDELLTKGLELYQAGKFPEALAAFQSAADANPDAADPLYMLGVMYEKGDGVAASDVEAARYYRLSWKKGSEKAHERLNAMYAAAASGQKAAPPVPLLPVVTRSLKPAEPAAGSEVVLEVPLDALGSLKGVHLRSSQNDHYQLIVACPDNCTDLSERAGTIATLLGATVSPAGAGASQPAQYESISYQLTPVSLSAEGEPAAQGARPLDLKLICEGWCKITRVVAKSIAQKLVESEP